MFDLEQHIAAWRRQQAEALGARPGALDELEGHLRDIVQELTAAGRPPEEAWRLARARLGEPGRVAAEFAKLPAPRRRVGLAARLVQAAMGLLAVIAAGLLVARWWQGRFEPLLAAHVFAVTVGYTALFAAGALAAWAVVRRAWRGGDAETAEALRVALLPWAVGGLALTAVGVLLGGVWAQEHMGRFWGWDTREVGGLSVLAWQGLMLVCVTRRPFSELAATLLGVLGNVVTSLAWFGPAVLDARHANGFGSPVGLALLAFALAQVLLLAAALAPEGWLARRRA